MSLRRFPRADDLVEEDTGTERMLREEKDLLRHSSNRRNVRSQLATASIYEEKPKLWTATDQGHLMHCAKLTASSVLDKNADFWNCVPELQKLEVEDGKALMKTLTKRLSSMHHLESLSITWTEMKALPSCCLALPLKVLVLQQDNLHSVDGVEVLTTLEVLDVSTNCLSVLPKALGNLQNLQVLNVCGNRLKQLPASLGSLRRLQALNCSSNRISTLPDSLTSLDQLVDLDVSSNRIDRLPEDFGNLEKLADIRASGNHLTCLPKSFARLNNLVSLLLGNNKFLFVPMELGALDKLQNLNLRNNHISSVDCALASVKTLILDSNRLSSVCSGICRCTNLEVLSLEKNAIKTLSDAIGGLTNLRSLQLSENPLFEIPQEVLQVLDERHVKLRLLGTKYNEKRNQSEAGDDEKVNGQIEYHHRDDQPSFDDPNLQNSTRLDQAVQDPAQPTLSNSFPKHVEGIEMHSCQPESQTTSTSDQPCGPVQGSADHLVQLNLSTASTKL